MLLRARGEVETPATYEPLYIYKNIIINDLVTNISRIHPRV